MIKMQIAGVEATVINLRGLANVTKSNHALEEAGRFLLDEVRKNISLSDHTLQQLADLDHPYARRHERIRVHTKKPWMVHTQSGKLLSALKSEVASSGSVARKTSAFRVWLDQSIAPHAKYVIEATDKSAMLPRNVLWNTANDKRVSKKIMVTFVRVLGKDLRTQVALRFKSVPLGNSKLGV